MAASDPPAPARPPYSFARGHAIMTFHDTVDSLISMVESRVDSGLFSATLADALLTRAGRRLGIKLEVATAPAPDPKPKIRSRKVKGKQIDARMLKKLADCPKAAEWTSREWAAELDCATSTVCTTRTWRLHLPKLLGHRRKERADKMNRESVRPRGKRKAVQPAEY